MTSRLPLLLLPFMAVVQIESPALAADCFPACRTGFVCDPRVGQCVSVCNPICGPNERCTAEGACAPREVAVGPGQATVPAGSTGWSAAKNGVRMPLARHQHPTSGPAGTLTLGTRLDIELDLEGGEYDGEEEGFETETNAKLYFQLDYAFEDRFALGLKVLNPLALTPDISASPPILYAKVGFTDGPGLVQAGLRAEVLFPFEEVFAVSIAFPLFIGNDTVQTRLTPEFTVAARTGEESGAPLVTVALEAMVTLAAGHRFYMGPVCRVSAVDLADDDPSVYVQFGVELGGSMSAPKGNLEIYGRFTVSDFWSSGREEVDPEVFVFALGLRAFNGFL